MLAVSEKDSTNMQLYCQIDDQIVNALLIQHFNGAYSCKWANYFVDCPVNGKPNKVALVDYARNKHNVSIYCF